MNHKAGDFDILHNVNTGRHFYQFYKGVEDYSEVMVTFFNAGLVKGEACLWLVSEKKNLSKVRAFAERCIPNYGYYVSSGQLQILSAEKWYLKNGRFNAQQAFQNAVQVIKTIQGKGYSRLRGAGDAAAVDHRDWYAFHAYEDKINAIVKTFPIIVLCAYPILSCSLRDTRSVIENHDDVLVGEV